MPSVPERLATLEGLVQELRRRLEALHADIHSGPGVAWDQSVRGRLHDMSALLATADKLAEAAREVRRMKDQEQKSRLKRWQWLFLAGCALVAASSPYVILLVH